jgi:hypothetical protein
MWRKYWNSGVLGYIRATADPAGGDVVHKRFLMEEGFAEK